MPTPDLTDLTERLSAFMQRVYPAEEVCHAHLQTPGQRWSVPPVIEELKQAARAEGLWNLWCPHPDYGAGLNNREYAPLAEIMGRSLIAPELFNCNAPDTGNMETLIRFADAAQRERWLPPLLAGEIRSAFCMTEPAVASSDPTNLATTIHRDGDDYVINGHKWWATGAMHPHCELLIVMGVSDTQAPRHKRHSIILVPRDAPGIDILRPLEVFGFDEAPYGHAEIRFNRVRVPADHLLLGEGRGFEIAQGRLGPGRIHHCMRLVGCAERSLELACRRANTRRAFGGPLAEQGALRAEIAHMACDVMQARLLTLHAADSMDTQGDRNARHLIGMAKIRVPRLAQRVIDTAMQIHGAKGLSPDTFLAEALAYARYMRLADGPDQVHEQALAKHLLRAHA